MNFSKKLLVFSFLCLGLVFLFVPISYLKAQTGTATPLVEAPPAMPGQGDPVILVNPLSVDTPQALIGRVINAVLGIVGSVALIMFIYGGFVWMTAGGNDRAISQGRGVLMWAAIGLIVIFTSYAIVRFILVEAL